MAYSVPDLPYAYDALEPHIDEATMQRPPRQAPPGLRRQSQRRPGGDRVGRQGRRGGPRRTSRACPRTSRARSATTAAATTTTRCSGRCSSPDGGGEPGGDIGSAIADAFGSFDSFKDEFKEAGITQFGSGWAWLVHDGSGLAVAKTAEPGLARLQRPDAAARLRRLGARLLPQVPEQAPRLHRRLLERRQLGLRRAAPRRRRLRR